MKKNRQRHSFFLIKHGKIFSDQLKYAEESLEPFANNTRGRKDHANYM